MLVPSKTLACMSLIALTMSPGSLYALDPSSKDPSEIMRTALDPQTGSGRSLMRMKMTIKQGSATRERVMNLKVKRTAQDRKTLIVIEQPADVRSTGILSLEYKARNKSDEQWLYLPALHRVSRVPSSGKSDSFVGSDFSVSDLSGRDPEDYDFKLVEQSAKVGDEDCWLIESVPRTETVKTETGYVKVHSWISKSKQIPIQLKAWTVSPEKIKYLKAIDVRQDDGTWTPHRLQMRTVDHGTVASETVIDVLTVNNAAELGDADFTKQRLENGST
jgi:hypothetical protein